MKLKTYLKNNLRTESPGRILDVIFLFMVLLFIMSTTFDFSVTFANFINNPDDFFKKEANINFVEHLEKEKNPFTSISFIINVALIILFCLSYSVYKFKPNTITGIVFLTFFILIYGITIGHFVGGASWLF